MAEPISGKELAFINTLKDAAVLRKIKKVNPLLTNGFIFLTCGDCNRFPESYRYQKNLIKKAGMQPEPHLIALNGGPLLIPEHSPLNVDGESRVVKRQIAGSLELKKLDVILAMFHGPCGAAQLAGLTIEESFRWYFLAITELQELHPNTHIVTQCHLHKPDELSTYEINLERLAQANFSNVASA